MIHPRMTHWNQETGIRIGRLSLEKTQLLRTKCCLSGLLLLICRFIRLNYDGTHNLFLFFYWHILNILLKILILLLCFFWLFFRCFSSPFLLKLLFKEGSTFLVFFDDHLCSRKFKFESMCCSSDWVFFLQY